MREWGHPMEGLGRLPLQRHRSTNSYPGGESLSCFFPTIRLLPLLPNLLCSAMEVLRIPVHCNLMLLIFLERDFWWSFLYCPQLFSCLHSHERGRSKLLKKFLLFFIIFTCPISLLSKWCSNSCKIEILTWCVSQAVRRKLHLRLTVE